MAVDLLGGRYELRGVLGRGGMAEVRDGWDTRLGRAVAIKLLYPGFNTDPDTLRRFQVEAHSAASLSHPNIVAVYDIAEHNGMPFIVMERLPGQSLAELIAHGPVQEPLVRRVLDEVLAALAAAHDAGILHRDIKPGNILFTASGVAKVGDFGVAKTPWADQTMAGQIVGTMAYLSPDRVAGKPAAASDDVYAVGVVGYEALTGRRPFDHPNMAALARAIIEYVPPPLAVMRPGVDPALAAAVQRAMSHDGRAQFPSAEEMRAALSPGGPGVGPVPRRPPTRVMTPPPSPPPPTVYLPPPARPRRRRAKTLIAIAAVLAALVVAGLVFLVDTASQSGNPDRSPVTTSTPASTTPPTTSTSATTSELPPPNPGKGNKKGPGKAGE
jgi:serine/threonine protein kinase